MDLVLIGVEMCYEGDQRLHHIGPGLGGLYLVEVLNDGETRRHALVLNAPDDQLAKPIDFDFRGEHEDDKVGHSGGIHACCQISLQGNVLQLLLESVDRDAEAGVGDLGFDVNARIQALDGGRGVDVATERHHGNDPGSAITSSENGCLILVVFVLLLLELLCAVPSVELGHDLLVRRLAQAALIG